MRRIKNTQMNYLINGICISVIACCLSTSCCRMDKAKGTVDDSQSFVESGIINSMENGTKWSRCFMTSDKLIYFKDSLMSRDGGKTLVKQESLNLQEINGAPERAVLSTGELFYALNGPTEYIEPGSIQGKIMEIS